MKIVFPLPSTDFDPTETAVPWALLTEAGHEVIFATPDAKPAKGDQRMLSGKGLLFLAPILRARKDARDFYAKMLESEAFLNPISWEGLNDIDADALVLPGGHDKGIIPYLESPLVQNLAAKFMKAEKPVGAICHGVVVLARAQDSDGRGALQGRRTTALTQAQELSAWGMTMLWMGRYYRTYAQTVEAEVREALGSEGAFLKGPLPMFRDRKEKLNHGFVVQDRNYVSARWPGDVYRFSTTFLALLESYEK